MRLKNRNKGDVMRPVKILLIAAMASLVISSVAIASDFAWTNVFDVEAYSDPLELRRRLVSRFNLDDLQLNVILTNFDSPADAYIVLRLGEMSGRPTGYVFEKYKHNKGTGWDAVASSLGIKPGSGEFYALKRDHDLHDGNNNNGQVVDAGHHSASSQ
jgi:hypothetical protein